MICLFDLYTFCSLMIWVARSGQRFELGIRPRFEMFAKVAMTFLCMTCVAFYVRFLMALWKESKPRSSGYWVRLTLGSGEPTIAELPKQRKPVRRAA
jgi:hypothetical protein